MIEVQTPQWISVDHRLPYPTVPVLLWGSALGEDDFPLLGHLCQCHGWWILRDWEEDRTEVDDSQDYLRRMLGDVTHWLDWMPLPI
jgi:hypothetical protein